MIRKEIFIGFLVGIISNVLGVILALIILSSYSKLTIKTAFIVTYEEGNAGSILALGALLNLVSFFLFIRLKRDYRARGVLLATLLTAVLILLYKLLSV
ncbi:hypothetical protein [Ascidiimonas aurantiaca]|uniref:hypothetical protein n=1 Tax=Ascidiimonas aurantiaca TaxID=1685432 RepID=UPI0030EE0CA2